MADKNAYQITLVKQVSRTDKYNRNYNVLILISEF